MPLDSSLVGVGPQVPPLYSAVFPWGLMGVPPLVFSSPSQLIMSTLAPSQTAAGLARPSVNPFSLVLPGASPAGTTPLSVGSLDPPAEDTSFSISNDVEQMDVFQSTFRDTLCQVGQDPPPPPTHSIPPTDLDTKSYDQILSINLNDLGKSELLV